MVDLISELESPQYGPLSGYVQVVTPIILEVTTGFMINSFAAGITFNTAMPDIEDASELATDPGFKSQDKIFLVEWKDILEGSVVTAHNLFQELSTPEIEDALNVLANPFKIEGSITLAFHGGSAGIEGEGRFMMDNKGKFLIGADLTIGGTISGRGTFLIDVGGVFDNESQEVRMLLYAQIPREVESLNLLWNFQCCCYLGRGYFTRSYTWRIYRC